MAASNVNVVVITGNLTQDPELRSTGGGTSVCEMRVAVNSRRKNAQTGEWVDKPNYFNVVVFGAQADNCATYLSKGRPVAIDGRLDWREWEAKDGSGKRQAVQIIGDSVQFLGPKPEGVGVGQVPVVAAPVEVSVEAPADPLAMEDGELAQLPREELDEIAVAAGVKNPDEYRQRRQVVYAIREAQAEEAVSDFGPVSGIDLSEPEF